MVFASRHVRNAALSLIPYHSFIKLKWLSFPLRILSNPEVTPCSREKSRRCEPTVRVGLSGFAVRSNRRAEDANSRRTLGRRVATMRDHSHHIELSRDDAVAQMLARCPFDAADATPEEGEAGRSWQSRSAPSSKSRFPTRTGACSPATCALARTSPTCSPAAWTPSPCIWSSFEGLGEGVVPDTSSWVRGVDWEFANTGAPCPPDSTPRHRHRARHSVGRRAAHRNPRCAEQAVRRNQTRGREHQTLRRRGEGGRGHHAGRRRHHRWCRPKRSPHTRQAARRVHPHRQRAHPA